MTLDATVKEGFDKLSERLKGVVLRKQFELVEIHSYGYAKYIERLAESFESEKRKDEAYPLRIAIALFYLIYGSRPKERKIEEAAYQISKAGSDAFYTGDQQLVGELRQIAAECYSGILKEESPTDTIWDAVRRERIIQEYCYTLLYEAEAFAKLRLKRDEAEKCLDRFIETANEVKLEEKKITDALRSIRRHSSTLSSKVDRYCNRQNISLRTA